MGPGKLVLFPAIKTPRIEVTSSFDVGLHVLTLHGPTYTLMTLYIAKT